MSVLEGHAYLLFPARIQSTSRWPHSKNGQLPLLMLPLVFSRREVQSPGRKEFVGILEQARTNSSSVFRESF